MKRARQSAVATVALAGLIVGAGGAWERFQCAALMFQGLYSVECYGAVPGDGRDDYAAIQAALDAAGKDGSVFFPAGRWHTTRTVEVSERTLTGPESQSYYGVSHGRNTTTLAALAPMRAVISAQQNPFRVAHLAVDGNGAADVGVYAFKAHSVPVLEYVNVRNVRRIGIFLDQTWIAAMQYVGAHETGGDGIVLDGCNASSLTAFATTNNSGRGLVVRRTKGATAGMYVMRGQVEANGSHGVEVEDTRSPLTLAQLWVEANRGDGVLVRDSWAVTLQGARVSGNPGECETPRGARVLGISYYFTAVGNQFDCPDPGRNPYDTIYIETDWFNSNTMLGGGT